MSRTVKNLVDRTPFLDMDDLLLAAQVAAKADNRFLARVLQEMFGALMNVADAECGLEMYMRSAERSLADVRTAWEDKGMVLEADFLIGHVNRIKERQQELHAAAQEFRKYNHWLKEELPHLSFDLIVAMGIEENGMVREAKTK